MKIRVLAIVLLALLVLGCARIAKVRRPTESTGSTETPTVAKRSFTVGERFTFSGAWKGIPIGYATATVEELTKFRDYDVYKVVVVIKTNKFLSKLFKVEDTITSYIDRDKFISRRYEADRREGRYRKNLIVDYDFKNCTATYKNLTDGSVKTCPIDKNVQDPVSAAYFFRTIPVKVGDSVKVTVNLNEENYEVHGKIEKRANVSIPKLGRFDAFLVRPYIKLAGKRQRKASARGYFSENEKRLGLYMVVNVLAIPWVGEVTATLEKVEYL